MKTPPASLLLVLVTALCCGAAWAEKADRNKPMNVEADALRYDDLQQTSVFTGKVVLTKGTIIIRGAQLTVRQDPDGNQFGLVKAEPGKLAYFRQKREGLDEFIEGEGETIDYNGKADTVKFMGRAQLRRYKGAVLNDEMTGGLIVYDNSTEVFTIDKGAASGSPTGPGGRVRAMLTPAAAADAAAKPAPAGPAPTLKPSTALEGAAK